MRIRKKTTDELVLERPKSENIMQLPRTPICVIADNIRSLDNVGLLFRLCETARIEKLYLTGYTGYPRLENDTRPENVIDRHTRRIEKAAVYALPYQPWEHEDNPAPLVNNLKTNGYVIISLEQTDTSAPYHTVPSSAYHLPIALIVGHERVGVRDELLSLSDFIVEIPILGIGNSHNVAISCGIVLYHILERNGLLTPSLTAET